MRRSKYGQTNSGNVRRASNAAIPRQRTPSIKQTEAQFLRAVIEYAQLKGWKCFHARAARTKNGWRTAMTGDAGFPDLCMSREQKVVFAELKTEYGRLTAMQSAWLYHLPNAYCWNPRDWRQIEDVLK